MAQQIPAESSLTDCFNLASKFSGEMSLREGMSFHLTKKVVILNTDALTIGTLGSMLKTQMLSEPTRRYAEFFILVSAIIRTNWKEFSFHDLLLSVMDLVSRSTVFLVGYDTTFTFCDLLISCAFTEKEVHECSHRGGMVSNFSQHSLPGQQSNNDCTTYACVIL